MPPDLSFEIEHHQQGPVAGVDEAGRGPLAGPVVAAAVILDHAIIPDGIDDSKKLCGARRESLCQAIRSVAMVGIGIASVEEIDTLNIYWATMLAMTRAVDALGRTPGHVLVDGNRLPRWSYASRAIVGGDALCLSIAAASIVAKHERDCLMRDYDRQYPGYGWSSNKGYGTRDHRDALERLGPTPLHRKSFAPVSQLVLNL